MVFHFPLNNRKKTGLPGALGRPRRGGRCCLRAAARSRKGRCAGFFILFYSSLQSPRASFRPLWLRSRPRLSARESTIPPGYGPFKVFPQLSPSFSQLGGGPAISSRLERPRSRRCGSRHRGLCRPSHTRSPNWVLSTAQSGLPSALQGATPTLCVPPLLKLCKEV